MTFDDLPSHGPLPPGVSRTQVLRDILSALKNSGTSPVYGFMNGVRLEQEPETRGVLELWQNAGYPLGNHTWSHMNLNDHTSEQWEMDLIKNEVLLSTLMPHTDWHWVRFPFLSEGESPVKTAEVRSFLRAYGYRIAGVTMSFADYMFNEPYARCMAAGKSDQVTVLESLYLKAAQEEVQSSRAMAQAALGHEIPLVLLMHVGAFDAHMLPRLLAMYKQDGVHLVSLEEAEHDPFYRNDLDLELPASPDSLAAALGGRPMPSPRFTPPTEALDKMCR